MLDLLHHAAGMQVGIVQQLELVMTAPQERRRRR